MQLQLLIVKPKDTLELIHTHMLRQVHNYSLKCINPEWLNNNDWNNDGCQADGSRRYARQVNAKKILWVDAAQKMMENFKVGDSLKGSTITNVTYEDKGGGGLWVVVYVKDTPCLGEWADTAWKDDGCQEITVDSIKVRRMSRKVNTKNRSWENAVEYMNSTFGDTYGNSKIVKKTYDKPTSGTQGIWS